MARTRQVERAVGLPDVGRDAVRYSWSADRATKALHDKKAKTQPPSTTAVVLAEAARRTRRRSAEQQDAKPKCLRAGAARVARAAPVTA